MGSCACRLGWRTWTIYSRTWCRRSMAVTTASDSACSHAGPDALSIGYGRPNGARVGCVRGRGRRYPSGGRADLTHLFDRCALRAERALLLRGFIARAHTAPTYGNMYMYMYMCMSMRVHVGGQVMGGTICPLLGVARRARFLFARMGARWKLARRMSTVAWRWDS